jgi:hypothetical protein
VWTQALIFLAGAALATAYFLLKNRRNTPYLELDLDGLPALADDLHALAAISGGNVSRGNDCRVLQNGALYPAMGRISPPPATPSTSKHLYGPRASWSAASSTC